MTVGLSVKTVGASVGLRFATVVVVVWPDGSAKGSEGVSHIAVVGSAYSPMETPSGPAQNIQEKGLLTKA